MDNDATKSIETAPKEETCVRFHETTTLPECEETAEAALASASHEITEDLNEDMSKVKKTSLISSNVIKSMCV